jgi:hypothetical protein
LDFKLDIQKIIDGISLMAKIIKLGDPTWKYYFRSGSYLLDNNGITVSENEIIILTLATVNSTLVQKQYLWKLKRPV